MQPDITYRTLPSGLSVYYPGRIVRLGVLHHTGRSAYDPVPDVASWDRTFKKNGSITVWNDDLPERATFHTGNTLRWRPPAVAVCPDGRVSDANYSGIGYEIQYDPDAGETPTPEQYSSIRWQLGIDHARFGPIIWVGHGQVDSTKRFSEPTALHFAALGCRWVDGVGYLYEPPTQEEELIDPISADDFKRYLEIYGVGANPATAIFNRAHLAYQRGERTGPLLGPEYDHTYPATEDQPERHSIRQDFTNATLEYDPASGGVARVEVNLERPRP